MTLITNFLLAIGLAMDAFAVSISSGSGARQLSFNKALTMALFFGIFQAIMPLIGWFAGMNLSHLISDYDHWIAFLLLSFLGLKMLYDAIYEKEGENMVSLGILVLVTLSIATSIDALAVGISFAFLGSPIFDAVVTIAIVTFLMSFCGAFIGKNLGHILKSKAQIIGGFILVGIGLKILLGHLF